MDNKGLSLWAAVLLLVGGLVHLIPGLYSGLADLTGGFPWIQVVVGILSVIVALVMFAGDKQEEGRPDHEAAVKPEGEKESGSDAL
jgi:hypothetical protein